MTLDQWREKNGYSWLNIERQLCMSGNGSIFMNRINRLKAGKSTPTEAELKALLNITSNEVDDYRD